MKLTALKVALLAALLLIPPVAPVRADYCLRLTGGPFTGDIGFFRFAGTRPSTPGAKVVVKGRAAGLSPFFGAAVVAKDGSSTEIGATFFIDGVQGQFDIAFSPPLATTGSGYGDYGTYGTSHSVTVRKVACSTEP